MCYAVLCCTVLCCAVLYCAMLCCTMLYCAVLCCTVLYYAVLCCAVLYCAMLCCAVLYCTVLCCTVLCCTVLCCAVLCYAMLCCTVLCCTVLCCAVLCYAVLYCAVLYCAVLYCAMLCCTVLCCAVLCCTVLCCAVLCYAVLYCAMLCYAVLYYTLQLMMYSEYYSWGIIVVPMVRCAKRMQQTVLPLCTELARCTVRHAYSSMCATLPESVPSCKASQRRIAALLRHVSPNCGAFGKKRCSTIFRMCHTNPEANHKSVAHFLSKHTQIVQIVCILLTRTVLKYFFVFVVVAIEHSIGLIIASLRTNQQTTPSN